MEPLTGVPRHSRFDHFISDALWCEFPDQYLAGGFRSYMSTPIYYLSKEQGVAAQFSDGHVGHWALVLLHNETNW